MNAPEVARGILRATRALPRTLCPMAGPWDGAMSSNADRNPSTDEPSLSRRRVLAVAGAGALASVPGVVGTASGQPARETVVRPSGRRRSAIRDRALADPAVERLRAELTAAGYRPDRASTVVARTSPDEGPAYHTVVLPFDRAGTDAQAAVVWTDRGPFPVQAREFRPLGDGTLAMRSHVLEGDDLVTATETVDPSFWWWICSDLNWPCVLSIAGAWAGTFASCGACILDPSKLTCIACVGAVLSATGATLGCDWCH